jgi:phage anti-repressor protein
MKTIKSNFIEGEDYKVLLFPMEKQKTTEETRGGHNKEEVMLNIDTFKNLCMIAKTSQGKDIRKYYVKLENIYNKIIKMEIEESKKLLENTKHHNQLLELNLQENQRKIEMMTRKTNKFEKGESIYIFHSTIEEDGKLIHVYKPGRTKNANRRDTTHKGLIH